MKCSKKAATTALAAVATAISSTYTATGTAGAGAAGATGAAAAGAVSKAGAGGIKGFNYGAFFMDQSAVKQSDFEYEFKRAQNLANTTGWNSARLYTTIQHGTTNTPISAIPAAIATKTTLLLGLWVSGGSAAITNELAALNAAIATYGTAFTDLVVGISVGSEDLYRDAQGDAKNVGVGSATLIDCIKKVRSAIQGTALAKVPVGHVDTYDSFFNGTNTAVVDQLDWIGFDGYPYWEKANANGIEHARELFYKGLEKTKALAKGKPVYVTETGWPASGDDYGSAVASPANARTYWKEVACSLVEAKVNVWWYILQQSQMGKAKPDFGIFPAGDLNSVAPLYDLSC